GARRGRRAGAGGGPVFVLRRRSAVGAGSAAVFSRRGGAARVPGFVFANAARAGRRAGDDRGRSGGAARDGGGGGAGAFEIMNADYLDRFGGLGRLYGRSGLERLAAARVCVVGLGGVGSWAAEALAR